MKAKIDEAFSSFERKLKADGYSSDEISLDRIFVENHNCRRCRRRIVYKAFSRMNNYRAFGVCETCDTAREFYNETAAA